MQAEFLQSQQAANAHGGQNKEIVMLADGKEVGTGSFFEGPTGIYIEMINICEDQRGNGYGPQLFAEIFRHAAEHPSHTLILSSYTDLGWKHLHRHQEELHKKFPQVDVVHAQWC